jgi:hypothetical protein
MEVHRSWKNGGWLIGYTFSARFPIWLPSFTDWQARNLPSPDRNLVGVDSLGIFYSTMGAACCRSFEFDPRHQR